jgi:hypothetical protein
MNRKAKALMRSCVADSHLHYMNSISAYICLQNLDTAYNRTGTGSKIHSFNKLISLKMREKDDLRKHIGNTTNAIRDYEIASTDLELDEKKMHLLNSLPESFSNIITDLESDTQATTFEYIISRLLDAEVKMKNQWGNGKAIMENNSHSALFNASKYRRKCYNCNGFGHIAKDCRYSKTDKNQNRFQSYAGSSSGLRDNNFEPNYQSNFTGRGFSSGRGRGRGSTGGRGRGRNSMNSGSAYSSERKEDNNDNGPPHSFSAFVTSTDLKGGEKDWILDSGCTDHMSQNEKRLMDNRETTPWPVNSSKKGKQMTVSGKSSMHIPVANEENQKIMMSDVLHVPDVGKNLMSIRKFDRAGYKVVFYENCGKVYAGDKLILEAPVGEDELYHFQAKSRSFLNEIKI